MKHNRVFPLTLLVFHLGGLGAVSVYSQTLAEVAKKEKARRGNNSGTATRTITDRELASSFGGLPPASSTVQTPASGEGGTEAAPAAGKEGEAAPKDETKTPEYWQNRVKASKDKIAKLEQQLQSEDWGEGQRMGVDPRGANNLGTRQKAEQDLAAARAELQAIQAEARKAGVPPGWVR
jgi:hypothetical protein